MKLTEIWTLSLCVCLCSSSRVRPVASVCLQTSRRQCCLQLHSVRRPWAAPHLAEERQTADTQQQRQAHKWEHVRAQTQFLQDWLLKWCFYATKVPACFCEDQVLMFLVLNEWSNTSVIEKSFTRMWVGHMEGAQRLSHHRLEFVV